MRVFIHYSLQSSKTCGCSYKVEEDELPADVREQGRGGGGGRVCEVSVFIPARVQRSTLNG